MLGCAKKQSFDSILSKEPENLRLMAEAKLIFGDILESGASYSSYSSDRVSYEIKDLNLSLEGWLLKNKLLEKRGWKFLAMKNNAYVYCQDKTQFEVIPPQSILKNDVLEGGDIHNQLENTWNLGFYTAKTNSPHMCEQERRKNNSIVHI